ncbi:MAG: CopG family transcriptional regulator [Betaproteobacteria bacterium]
MSTIRLPARLKTRVAAAAKRAGKTTRRFILEAIAERTAEEERRGGFHDVAEKRYASIVASGKTIPWSEMRTYLHSRLAGGKPRRPAAAKDYLARLKRLQPRPRSAAAKTTLDEKNRGGR